MASTWNSYQPEASSIWPGSLNEELGTKMERQEILLENDAGSDQRAGTGDSFQGIIGSSRTLKQTLDQVMTVAPTDSTVLIEGETGTGKELIARAIHNLSSRRDRNFVKFNCAAVPLGLLRASCSGTSEGHLQGQLPVRLAALNWQTREHFSWTKSATSLPNSRPSCCAFCKSRSLKGWVAPILNE